MSNVAMSVPALGPAFQLGIIVRDIEAAMQHYIKTLGIGPFIYMEDAGAIDCTYRGKPTDVKIHVAFSYTDNMQVELIQQYNDAPSPYRDFLASGREGLQHIAYYANEFREAVRQLEAGGLRHVYTIEPRAGGEQIFYFEGAGQSTMTELVPLSPLRRRYHATLLAQTKGWEGDRPIRRYQSIPHFYEAFGLV
jgi:hypothetical protein